MKRFQLVAVVIAFSSILSAQTPAQSSVEGQVVSSAGGAPVRRATVTLRQSGPGYAVQPGQPPRELSTALQTDTDDQGHFAFANLEAGGYAIDVERQGYVRPNAGGGMNQQLWLGEGQHLTGYVIRVAPQAVIAGRVLDESGDPVMGAQVSAQRPSSGGGRAVPAGGSVQTNDLGEYRIAGLSAGDYIVAASYQQRNRVNYSNQQPPGDKPQTVYATTYHPGATDRGQAEPVHVHDGAVTSGVEIKLAKIQAYSIHVTVVDPDAPPNAVAYPNLRPSDPTATMGFGYPTMRQTDGSVLYTGVPPGSYVITAQRNNPNAPGAVASASVPVEVRDRNIEGLVVEIKPSFDLQGSVRSDPSGQCTAAGVSVSLRPPGGVYYGPFVQPVQVGGDSRFTLKSVAPGTYDLNFNGGFRCYVKSVSLGGQIMQPTALTVRDAAPLELTLAPYSGSVGVTVVDGRGNPLPRAQVRLFPQDAMSGGGVTGSTTADGGTANFAAVRPGTYDVLAVEGGGQMPPFMANQRPTDSRAKTITVAETGRTTVQVTAIPASETGGASVSLPSAKGSLAGRVVNSITGAAMPGVVVTLRGMYAISAPQEPPSAVSDEQGRFSFPELTPGIYSLTAMEQRFVRPGGPGGPGGLATQAIVGEGQQVSAFVLKMSPASVISGTVKDETGEPVLGARVQAFHYRNQMDQRRLMSAGLTQTDDLGQYRIFNLAPGDYYVEVAKAPRRVAAVRPGVAAQPPTVGGALQGPGTAIANSSEPQTIAVTLPAPETDYVPMWYPNSAQPLGATAVRLAAGATAANIDMTWKPTHVVSIRGKVLNAASGAISVSLTAKNSPVTPATVGNPTVARDGTFEISSVPPGSYVLVARPGVINGPAGPMAVQSVDVKDAPIEGIQLELSGGRQIKGTVRMADGGPVPRPGFFTFRPLDGVSSVTTNMSGDGTFTVNNIFPLVYAVDAQRLPANTYIQSIRSGGQEVPLTGFEFKGDGQLVVVFAGTAAVLEGSITDAAGNHAGNAGVVVAPVSGSAPVRAGTADANGNFYFANLPPGDYRVAAWDAATPEASDPPESLTAFAQYAKTVTLGEKADVKVQVTVVPPAR